MLQRINGFLRSEAATLLLLTTALVAQAPHAATVFHRLAPVATGYAVWLAWMHAGAYAVALELATLVFVVRGQQRLAWCFAAVSVAVNVAYYWQPGLTLHATLSAALIAIALPVAIATYSHDVARHTGDTGETAKTPQDDLRGENIHQTTTKAPVDVPSVTAAHADANSPEPDTKQRAVMLASEGLKPVQIASQLNLNPSTVRSWLRRAATQTNGVSHL